MRFTRLSPTLVTLAVLGLSWSPLRAETATAEQRDAQFESIRSLIDAEIRGPAERQKSDFQSAGYPEATWFQKFLDWDFADHFQTMTPNQVEDLGKELSSASADAKSGMPEAVRKAYKGGGGTLLRLVNELAKIINPDDAPTLTGKENISAEEKQRRNFLVRDLLADSDREWKDLAAVVTKAENDANGEESKIWNLQPNDPQYAALSYKACDRRLQAVHVLYLAHIVLREVITRGEDFGMDPAPVIAYYTQLLTEKHEWISKWDYDWADQFLPLKAEVNIMLCEAIRLKVPQIAPEDIETEMFHVLDADLRQFPQSIKTQLIDLQLSTWASLLRWRLEMGSEHDLKRGLENFKDLQDRLKELPVHLADGDHMGQMLASCYIVAARMKFLSNDVNGANSLLAEVVHNTNNRLSSDAKDWIAFLSKGVGPHNEWGAPPEPEDPEQVLGIAAAFLSEARQSEDLHHQHQMYMQAAVSLRNGILGLSDGYEDQFIDNAPALYERYAFTLSRLNLHYHAAIAAMSGLEAIANNIDEKTNPWHIGKDPKRKPTDSGKIAERLAKSSIIFASNLLMHDKDVGVQALYSKTISLVQKISPNDSDEDLVKTKLIFLINNGSYDDAISGTKDFIATYKKDAEAYFTGFDLLTDARMRKYEDLQRTLAKDPGAKDEMDTVAGDLKRSSEAIQNLLKDKKTLSVTERKAYSTALSTPTFINFSQGNYDQVINALDANFWLNAPADESVRARMLKLMCQSIDRKLSKSMTDAKNGNDLGFYLGGFPQQQAAYEIYTRQVARIQDDEAKTTAQRGGKSLAHSFNVVAANVSSLLSTDAKAAAMAKYTTMVDYAKKAVADLLYPELTASSDMTKILAVAGLLWDMDDHARGGHLYDIYIKHIAQDSELGGFKRSGKARLDQIETLIAIRPELHDDWAVIRDLLEDGPAVEDWRNGNCQRSDLTEKPIDYLDATVHLRAFRKRIDSMRTLIGEDDYKKMVDGLAKLESISYSLAQEILAKKRLAQWYRESGKSDAARDLYTELIHYDPDDPDSKTALVENVLQDLSAGHPVLPAQVEKARKISISVREDGGKDPFIFWTAQIQIFELSANLNDIESINAALHWLSNVGDISHDLVQPPLRKDARIVGDDPRIRRAKNSLAVDLANRFLQIYHYKGVDSKASFEVRSVDVDGKEWILFVDAGTPKIVGQMVENALGDQVAIFLPEGTSPLLAEGAPAPAPAPTGTPAKTGTDK